MKKRAFCLLCAACLLLLTACGAFGLSFSDMERQTYVSENGYSVQLPADWTKTEETQEQASFLSAAGDMSCTICCELGGVEYDSLEEVGELLEEQVGESLFDAYTLGEPIYGGTTYRNCLTGTQPDGSTLTADLNVYHVYPGVRYYMIFVTETETYRDRGSLISGVLRSFKTTLTQDEVYQLMRDRREAEAEAEMEAYLQELEQSEAGAEGEAQGEDAPDAAQETDK